MADATINLMLTPQAPSHVTGRKSTPGSVLALLGLAPLMVAYLAHFPNTKTLRLGAWGLGVICWVWALVTINIDPIMNLRVIYTTLFGFAAHYAFTGHVVQYHPLPRQPPLSVLRQFGPVQAVLLLIDGHRQITVKGFGPPLRLRQGYAATGPTPYLRALARHIGLFLAGTLAYDLASYPMFRLYPDSFGSPDQIGGDVHAWYAELSAAYGVSVLVVRMVLSALFLTVSHFGWMMQVNMFAAVCLCTGLYIPEEWPDFSDWPLLSTSLNDFWGRRWHMYMRETYLIAARPIRNFGRAAHMLAIFTISALMHIAFFYPRKHQLIVRPYLVFYYGNALACLAEREYKRRTRNKVGGAVG